MAAVLALVSAIFFGISDFTGGVASRRASPVAVVLVSNALSVILALVIAAAVPGSRLDGHDAVWGAAAGVVGLVGVLLLYRGLAIGPMSVVAPLTAVLSAVVPAVVGVIRGERPGALAITGVCLAIPAIALLSAVERNHHQPSGESAKLLRVAVITALGAGLSFGGFYVLLAQTGAHGGAWPLVTQRGASTGVLILVSAAVAWRHQPVFPRGNALRLGVVAGVTDFGANLAYLLATHQGLLSLVAVLSALYPGSTVLLARTVLSERLSRLQLCGLATAVAAVALIAVR